MRYIILTFIVFLGVQLQLKAQEKYWVFIEKKEKLQGALISEKTLENRKNLGLSLIQETDQYPDLKTIQVIKSTGAVLVNVSKWLNAVSVYSTDIESIKKLEGIKKIQQINSINLANTRKDTAFFLPFVLSQIHADALVNRGLNGKGVAIGVIDGGFYNADKMVGLQAIMMQNQIKEKRDFFNLARKDFYNAKESDSEFHGSMVLNFIGGFASFEKVRKINGLATGSDFYLARTESGKQESKLEEDNYVAALEWMDSLGVRLVNSSLGYTQGFTKPVENHYPEEMDGNTTAIAKAAKIAVEQKGMILVISAGNDGENVKWGGFIGTPADVQNVITVGANDEIGLKMDYSGKGLEFVNFTKPDITVFSANGTSFAAPIITGQIACLMQLKPSITVAEIKNILTKSSAIYPFVNNFVGAGFPDSEKCLKLLAGEKIDQNYSNLNRRKKVKLESNTTIAAFHKKDKTHVLFQELITKLDNGFFYQPKNVKYSTFLINGKVLEVHWK